MLDSDTIYALSSGRLPAAIAIIRISGDKVATMLQQLTDKQSQAQTYQAKHAHYINIAWQGALIDKGILLWFPAPNSYTGEDCVELQIHGSPAIIEKIFDILNQLGGRIALPGEFTKRALLNQKFDITQAEAINDLILAETEAQHQLALSQMQGNLSQYYAGLKQRLMALLAHFEAMIDFTEDEDFSDVLTEKYDAMRMMMVEIEQHLDDGHQGELIREGIKIALVGKPNTGKSTLLNKLAKKDIAITTPIAGTTRDIIEVALNVGGYQVIVSDSAGIRESADEIEQQGIARSKLLSQQVDIIIEVAAIDEAGGIDRLSVQENITADIQLLNKIDLQMENAAKIEGTDEFVKISLHNDMGVQEFLTLLTKLVQEKMMRPVQRTSPLITHRRYRDTLFHVKLALEESLTLAVRPDQPIELIAENLRHSVLLMGKLTGYVDIESLLDIIFSDFCIGK